MQSLTLLRRICFRLGTLELLERVLRDRAFAVLDVAHAGSRSDSCKAVGLSVVGAGSLGAHVPTVH